MNALISISQNLPSSNAMRFFISACDFLVCAVLLIENFFHVLTTEAVKVPYWSLNHNTTRKNTNSDTTGIHSTAALRAPAPCAYPRGKRNITTHEACTSRVEPVSQTSKHKTSSATLCINADVYWLVVYDDSWEYEVPGKPGIYY